MRFIAATLNDVRYQVRYGFYVLYLIVSVFYISVLSLLPQAVRPGITALVVLTDPATLGFMFIGAILLLERGEGLHGYLSVLPLKVSEYIAAKVVSLSAISVLSAVAVTATVLRGEANYSLLIPSLIIGSTVFTLTGIAIGSMAVSVNNYLFMALPVMLAIMLPALMAVVGLTHPLLELLPGTLCLRLINTSVSPDANGAIGPRMAGLLLWAIPAFTTAKACLEASLGRRGGKTDARLA